MTSFNFDSKKARNVGLTCRYHMSNKMRGSIFQESTGLGLTCFLLFLLCFFLFFALFFFCLVLFCLFCCYSCFVLFCFFFIARYICFPWNERDGISFITITPTASMRFEKSSICLRFQISNEEFWCLKCLSMLCCF